MKNTIRVERAKARITQNQLAEKVGMTGVAISNIETEKCDPKVNSALKIANYFKLKVADIFETD